MATIIDGSSYPKYWKITPDDQNPNEYNTYPKGWLRVRATGTLVLVNDTVGTAIVDIQNPTVDENGTTIDTLDKLTQYLHANDR